ncbi:hypothetical protein [Frankia sp. CiP1_Cm_nod2]|uniref:hypothetical protein n=1 Tax=Frankia sp. CiP1_Cm_nod2 TaxID=2897161 RepID=UPI0020246D9F
MRTSAGPCAVPTPREAARLLVVARIGLRRLHVRDGAAPAGTEAVFDRLADVAPLIDGPAAACLVGLLRAGLAELDRGSPLDVAVRGDLAVLADVAEHHRLRRDAALGRFAPGSRDSFAADDLQPGSWVSTTRAAHMFELDPSYLRRLAAQGALDARRTSKGRWQIRAESLITMAAQRRWTYPDAA